MYLVFRQLFCIMSYFFFFFNVIVGVIACFMRILKGALLGVVFLARIDRTSMIEGFYSWDPGKDDSTLFFFNRKSEHPNYFQRDKTKWFRELSCYALWYTSEDKVQGY